MTHEQQADLLCKIEESDVAPDNSGDLNFDDTCLGVIQRYRLKGGKPNSTAGWLSINRGDKHDDYYAVFSGWNVASRYTWGAKTDKKSKKKQTEYKEEAVSIVALQNEWQKLKPLGSGGHPYLDKKKVGAHGDLRLGFANNLAIPLYFGGQVIGWQWIKPDGTKLFKKGTKPKGAYYKIGQVREAEKIVICEGYATGATIHECTGLPVIIALSCNNLENVCKRIAESDLFNGTAVVVADNDEGTGSNGKKKDNVGLREAKKATLLFGERGYIAIPNITGDANDLYIMQGKQAVLDLIKTACVISGHEDFAVPAKFSLRTDGVYKEEVGRICSPLKVVAWSSSKDGKSKWGKVVIVVNPNLDEIEVDVGAAMIQENSKQVLAHLADLGLRIKIGGLVLEYIGAADPRKYYITHNKLGWIDDALSCFLTPDKTIGHSEETYVYRSPGHVVKGIKQSGTVQDWNAHVLGKVAKQKLFLFAIGASLVAPMLAHLEQAGFGIHFYGNSSTGKTTASHVAASIYGDPGQFVRQWKTTRVGLEDLAKMNNDLLLVLDEIMQASSRDIADSIYTLANGMGKQRGRPSGIPQDVETWRLVTLSNGEVSTEHIASKDGSYMAGHEVRMLDIPVNQSQGMFDNTMDPHQLAKDIKNACGKYYGTIGNDWIEWLAENHHTVTVGWKAWKDRAQDAQANTYAAIKTVATGQSGRVMDNIELCCYALFVARKLGLVKHEDLKEEAIYNLSADIFRIWESERGGLREREFLTLIDEIIYILASRASSFVTDESIKRGGALPHEVLGAIRYFNTKTMKLEPPPSDGSHPGDAEPNQAEQGLYKTNNDIILVHFIPTEIFKRKFCQKVQVTTAVKWLREEGILIKCNKKGYTRGHRINKVMHECYGLVMPQQNKYANSKESVGIQE